LNSDEAAPEVLPPINNGPIHRPESDPFSLAIGLNPATVSESTCWFRRGSASFREKRLVGAATRQQAMPSRRGPLWPVIDKKKECQGSPARGMLLQGRFRLPRRMWVRLQKRGWWKMKAGWHIGAPTANKQVGRRGWVRKPVPD